MESPIDRTDPRVYDPYEKSSPTILFEVTRMELGLASYHDAEFECVIVE